MNRSISTLLVFFLFSILSTDIQARCTGSPNCRACTNCSRCQHCSNGASCGVCAGSSSGHSKRYERNSSNSQSNGFYSSGAEERPARKRKSKRSKYKDVQQEVSKTFQDTVTSVVVQSPPPVVIEKDSGWKWAFFVTLIALVWVLISRRNTVGR